MGKAARLKRERRARKATDRPSNGTITLQNPVADHFPKFIIGNGLTWEAMAHDALIAANREAAESLEPYWGLMALIQSGFSDPTAWDAWQRFRGLVDEHCSDQFVVVPNSAKGQHVVICGAGPSLADTAAEYCPQADQVWGCNSALPWLVSHGHKVTHGFTVDQTPEMLNEWASAPDVEYLLATTVHPHLTAHLLKHGRKRLRWFHNYVGIRRPPVPIGDPDNPEVTQLIEYETWLYMLLFPPTMQAGSGLNTVNRAIDVALVMGFEKITVLGADCAMRITAPRPENMQMGSPGHLEWLRSSTVLHADGGHALASNSSGVTLGAEIDSGTPDATVRPGCGRWWESKVDLLISARWLLTAERKYPGRVEIVGDTYVAAIRGKNKAFLERLPAMVDSDGKPVAIVMNDL